MSYSTQIEALEVGTGKSVQLDNGVKHTRPISAFRDAAFMRDLEGLLNSALGTKAGSTSVCVCIHSNSSPLTPTLPPSITTTVKARARTRVLPWWHHPFSTPPARSYRVPAQWRDTSDILRVHCLHLALAELGPVFSFSLNLHPDVEAEARLQDNSLNWLHRRITRRLNQVLGRKVEFFVVLEETPNWTRRLHVHGELQVSPEEVKAARKAIRLAGGEWEEVRQHQAHTDESPDQGWAGYIAKDFWKFGPHVRQWTSIAPGSLTGTRIRGRIYASTSILRRKAVKTYEAHRQIVWRYRYGRFHS